MGNRKKKDIGPVSPVSPTNDWNVINLLARAYLDLQKPRVGFGLRIQRLEERLLVRAGLMQEVTTIKKSKNGNDVRRTDFLPIDKTKRTEKLIEEKRKEIRSGNEIHALLKSHEARLKSQEEDLKLQAREIFEPTSLWKFCLMVRGAGPVFALTCMGNINPERAASVSQIWRMVGLTPDSKFKKGVQGNFRPQLKGRFWLLAHNVILGADPYYSQLYRIKKEYYSKRPDLLAESIGGPCVNKGWNHEHQKLAKGWKGKIDNYAVVVLMKLLISHAYELIMGDYLAAGGKRPIARDKDGNPKPHHTRHRNPVPIKPEDDSDQRAVLRNYKSYHHRLLAELNRRWRDKTDIDHERYFDYMRNAHLE